MVLFFNFNGDKDGTTVHYFDDIILGEAGPAEDPMKLPVTFDDPLVNYNVVPFGAEGTAFEIVANPNPSGTNDTESQVGAITKTGAQYEGATFNLSEALDLSGDNKTLSVKVYSEVAYTVLLKLETGVNDERSNEVRADHGGTGWETLTFDFAADATTSYQSESDPGGEAIVPDGQYDQISLFLDLAGSASGTFYVDDLAYTGGDGGTPAAPTAAAPTPTDDAGDVQSIFSDAYTDPAGVNYYPDWGQSTTFEVLDFDGNEVIKYGNANYQGIDFGESLDLTSYSTLKIDVWSGDFTSIPIFLISEGSGEKSVSFDVTPNQWNTIEISLADFTSQGLDISDIFQIKFDVQPVGGTFYIDNLFFTSAEAAATEPQSAAPVPTADAGDVQSIYSDSYTNPAGINYYPDWGQSTTFEVLDFGGNEAIKYGNANYQGIDFGESLDLTAYNTLNIDVWSGDYTSIPIFLISAGSGENPVTLNVTPNQWNTIQIPLSDYTSQGLDISDIIQIKFDVQPDNGGAFYIDNLYFSSETDGGDTGSTTTSFPVNFETPANGGAAANWSVFENGDNPPLEIITNPDMNGNTSGMVAKFIAKPDGQSYAGTITQLTIPLTLDASNAIVKMWVWKSKISDVGIKFENAAGGSTGEIKVANTKTNEWEELTFDFSGVIGDPNNTDITGLVVFPDFEVRSSESVTYFDNITLNASSGGGSGGGGSTGTLGLPLDFDGSEDYVGSSSGVDFDVVTNPNQSGVNATATLVGEVINAGSQYEALTIALDNAMDFSGSNKTITMKVYSETAYQVLFKLETGVNGERANEVEVSHGGTGWEELTFDFNTARKSYVEGDSDNGAAFVPTGQYATFSIFLDFAGTTSGTFYIDDIEQN